MEYKGLGIDWLGHASVRIRSKKIIYIDPFNVGDGKADIILITHSHYDHLSIPDINKLLKPNTVIVAPPDCSSKLARIEKANIMLVEPNKTYNLTDVKDIEDINNIKIHTVPAYNIGKEFHPKINEWVGYIIEIGGVKIYHAGDTDLIPEMKNIEADIIFLPVGGTYTMNPSEAAKAANIIKPQIAVPMHYGSIVGTKSDAQDFKEKCKVEVKII